MQSRQLSDRFVKNINGVVLRTPGGAWSRNVGEEG
jgi:hypothetical protein